MLPQFVEARPDMRLALAGRLLLGEVLLKHQRIHTV